MLAKLLKKEFRLCLHPTTPIMPALSSLTLVPNYPYAVMYFYLTLGFFFICMNGREQHDVTYSLTLPVAKTDIVTARVLLFVVLELVQLALAGLMILLRRRILPDPNAAGMDANLALLGEGFLCYGLFHLVFFPSYYRDVNKVGVSFVKGSIVLFAFVIAEIVACYTVPLFRDVLDTPDPEHRSAKLLFLLGCALFYVLASFVALRISQKRFQKQDIR